ncbi:PstS family phosphate ABC transporter substrate-binding protein [Candidatus Thorarchaeota archaeon]|nr:MAG: PstS family phosphate ABC transporter substrate-binding protein [Candidatus Thorarchaeota archaeon]
MNNTTKIVFAFIVGILIGVGGLHLIGVPSSGSNIHTLSTAGSTTVFPLSQEWATQFHEAFPSIIVNPSTGGSGLGQSQVASQLIDIGASSSYPDLDFRTAHTDVKIIPVSADALGIVTNPTVNGSIFKMDCDMAVAIFQGNITTWEDFETTFNVIVAASGAIHVYVRADASGTTATFASWLETADENINSNSAEYEWGLGHKETVSWPSSHSAVDGNPGVASGVLSDNQGIGYVGLAFIEGLTPVQLYNPRINIYIEPTLENALRALPDELLNPGQNLMNSNNTDSYPIARLLYYLVNENNIHWYTIVYLNWVLVQGQQFISDVGYVPISGTSAATYALSVVSTLLPIS